jgi:MerR family transcriptional regulator, thiopeptide resistance regulator
MAVTYTVGQVARFAGVTVRTLHHYDAIGLLTPSGRSTAGYRTYVDDDLERLQRILAYRELELPLGSIAQLLAADGDPRHHLHRQLELVTARIARLRQLATTLERTMEAHRLGINLTPDELLEVFGDTDPAEHADEAERRWADTDAWRESHRRTATIGKDDWLRIKDESSTNIDAFAAAMADGAPADGDRAMALAEAAREHISRWFYDCDHEMHRHLGVMYVSDPRFTATYDRVAPGLARYVRDAIMANADRVAAR